MYTKVYFFTPSIKGKVGQVYNYFFSFKSMRFIFFEQHVDNMKLTFYLF